MKKLSRIPTMNLPEESGTYNIIQFYINDKPHIRFGEDVERLTDSERWEKLKWNGLYRGSHEQIISRFWEEINASPYASKYIGNGNPQVQAVPVLPSKPDDSIDCILVGAGTCILYGPSIGMKDAITPLAKFYGNSITYNRMICSYHLFEMRDEFRENGIDFGRKDIIYS